MAEIILTSLVTVMVPILSIYAKQSINARAEREEVLSKRLQEQRADFDSLLAPMKEELSRLRESVNRLESRLDQEERDSRLLLATLFDAVEKMQNAVPPIKMYLPARVQELLSSNYGLNH